jgi:hypothetical protein
MKSKLFLTATLIGVATLSARAGVDVGISIVVPAPPPVVVVAPVVVMVPDAYAWDGYENVGIVNGQYFYLGPGDVWLACDPDRLTRFHGWERDHADWRTHAIQNDRYRKDAHGDAHPFGHGGPEKADARRVGDGRTDKGSDKDARGKDDKKDDRH